MSDRGTGVKPSHMSKLFTYAFTTAVPASLEDGSYSPNTGVSPIAGYGYGLPLSRLVIYIIILGTEF